MPDDEQIDFTELAQRLREVRDQLTRATDDLSAMQGTGHGGDGLVTVTVSGAGRILDLQIDRSVIDPDDPQTLADLVIAALDDANQAVGQQRADRMAGVTEGTSDLLARVRTSRPRHPLASRRVPPLPGWPARPPGTTN